MFSFDQMHHFAAAVGPAPRGRLGLPAHDYEPVVRCFSGTGMRLGEVLPLCRPDLLAAEAVFEITCTAHEGEVQPGTKTDHGEAVSGRLAPCPPTLLGLIQRAPARIDTELQFPTPTGTCGASATSTATSGTPPSAPRSSGEVRVLPSHEGNTLTFSMPEPVALSQLRETEKPSRGPSRTTNSLCVTLHVEEDDGRGTGPRRSILLVA